MSSTSKKITVGQPQGNFLRARSSLGSSSAEAESKVGSDGLYTPFVEYCVSRMRERINLEEYLIEPKFRELQGIVTDSESRGAVSRSIAYQSQKIRQMRSADISSASFQVLNLIIFPRPEYDLPFFCADLITMPRGHIIVLDLNPLHRSDEYMDKYFRPIKSIFQKHIQTFPWGGELTSEALTFFSPTLIWARLPRSDDIHGPLFDAFKDYLEEWLDMLDASTPAVDASVVEANMDAQHMYMSWRCEKDPGRPLLTKLFGAETCEEYIHQFLFGGMEQLGSKSFLDHFPQYRELGGGISKKRSVAGKSFPTRPWDVSSGRLIL